MASFQTSFNKHIENTHKRMQEGFLIKSSSLLTISLKKRFQLDFDGLATFVKSSHLFKFEQCAHGSVVVFRFWSTGSPWKLAVISRIFTMNDLPVVGLFNWTGTVASIGVPKFAVRNTINAWSKISGNFTLHGFHPKDIELLFVNQIRGIPIGNCHFCPTTRNVKDRGFQCLSLGPDAFKPKPPSPF